MTFFYLTIAVDAPLFQTFDYRLHDSTNSSIDLIGRRVSIDFGRQKKIGIVVGISPTPSIDPKKVKSINSIIDNRPIFPQTHLDWLTWVSRYYHFPIGASLFTALPVLLRSETPALEKPQFIFKATTESDETQLSLLRRSPKQKRLFDLLCTHPSGMSAEMLNAIIENWRPTMSELTKKRLAIREEHFPTTMPTQIFSSSIALNGEQHAAVDEISRSLTEFSVFIVEGVTGSGKTEVYFAVIEKLLRDTDKQVLFLVPEIGLTPQLVQRFSERFQVSTSIMHSALNDRERCDAWLRAASGQARLIIGTRSAIFTPIPKLGLIVLDEEHDGSYKQQDGLRYHARDIAIVRGQRDAFPIVLGSATPSFETLANVDRGRFRRIVLPFRAGNANAPHIHLIDLRNQVLDELFTKTLLDQIRTRLDAEEQVLIFLNRRGYAPTLICHSCGWIAECRHCASRMTVHQHQGRLRCHHCGAERAIPHACDFCGQGDLRSQGYGTERIEKFLVDRFHDAEIIRIDRDTTQRKHSLADLLARAQNGKRQILIGTQMLAKGHHFPNVTLVALLNSDSGLFGADLRATEHTAQLIIQVAGRAGRADKPGTVLIQTYHPDHPLLNQLIKQGYDAFAISALLERKAANMPPYSFCALIRTQAKQSKTAKSALDRLSGILNDKRFQHLEVMGPSVAPMERKAGFYRMQLIILSTSRPELHLCLDEIQKTLAETQRVQWSIDVDPIDFT